MKIWGSYIHFTTVVNMVAPHLCSSNILSSSRKKENPKAWCLKVCSSREHSWVKGYKIKKGREIRITRIFINGWTSSWLFFFEGLKNWVGLKAGGKGKLKKRAEKIVRKKNKK